MSIVENLNELCGSEMTPSSGSSSPRIDNPWRWR